MVGSKGTRNLIIALIILAAGVWITDRMSDSIIAKAGVLGGSENLIMQFKQLSGMMLLGLGVIIIILIIVYALGSGKPKPVYQ